MQPLAQQLLAGQVRALARVITQVESRSEGYADLLLQIDPHTGRAMTIGITGAPGSGKSSLVDQLLYQLRKEEKTVGVIAIDPTSPFSGGALLGDRIRMQAHTLDRGVYIRSIANRGHSGGIARATSDIIAAIDAYGRDVIVVETTGTGQTELAVMEIVDLTLVVMTPETGDDIQALKAGMMEIADIFVINKADLKGALKLKTYIQAALSLSKHDRTPPIILTETRTPKGIDALWQTIENCFASFKESGLLSQRRKERRCQETTNLLENHILAHLRSTLETDPTFAHTLNKVAQRELTPLAAAQHLLEQYLSSQTKVPPTGVEPVPPP